MSKAKHLSPFSLLFSLVLRAQGGPGGLGLVSGAVFVAKCHPGPQQALQCFLRAIHKGFHELNFLYNHLLI